MSEYKPAFLSIFNNQKIIRIIERPIKWVCVSQPINQFLTRSSCRVKFLIKGIFFVFCREVVLYGDYIKGDLLSFWVGEGERKAWWRSYTAWHALLWAEQLTCSKWYVWKLFTIWCFFLQEPEITIMVSIRKYFLRDASNLSGLNTSASGQTSSSFWLAVGETQTWCPGGMVYSPTFCNIQLIKLLSSDIMLTRLRG